MAAVFALAGGPFACAKKSSAPPPEVAEARPEPAPAEPASEPVESGDAAPKPEVGPYDYAPTNEPGAEPEPPMAYQTAPAPPYPTAYPSAPAPPATRDEMPAFPWPPPKASALRDLPLVWLVDDPATSRLGDLDARLTAALDRVGYGQRSYFRVPGGFALSTRVERIAPDGTPEAGAERWALDESAARIFSLIDYLKALLLARPGRFRVLVFTVTPQSFATSGAEVSADEAAAWVTGGANRLPAALGAVELASAPFACTVLIYEFERSAESDPARVVVPGRLDGREHLVRAGLWGELAR